jgi:hypothetical protein
MRVALVQPTNPMTPARKPFTLKWPDALVLVLAAVLAVVFVVMHFGVTKLM